MIGANRQATNWTGPDEGLKRQMKTSEKDKQLIHHFLAQSAEKHPHKEALIHDNVRMTYQDLDNAVIALASYLQQNRVEKGERVAVLMENCPAYVIAYYGALRAGLVVAPLNYDSKPDQLKKLLAELEPRVLIASSRCERLLKAASVENADIQHIIIADSRLSWEASSAKITAFNEAIEMGRQKQSVERSVAPHELACIIYTSGSTGEPKGVMLSHANVVSNTLSICEYLRLDENDIQMVVLPFFYVMGKSLLNTHIAAGGTIVINNKFAFPATVIKQMVVEKVTGFSGVPSTYAYLLHRSPLKDYRDQLKSLRYCSQAGGHMSRRVKTELRDTLPEHTKVYIMYGATEAAARLSYLQPESFFSKMGSIGKAIPGVELAILDANGNVAADGQVGELVARGPNIMLGYWRDSGATRRVLDLHGYHTGDQAYRDADGFYFLQGRKDALVKVGGHRINLQEIEEALMETGLVVESAVIGVPDELLGNKLIAFVVPINAETSRNEMLAACAEKLPKFKMPSDIIREKALPKSANGKVSKEKLSALYEKPRNIVGAD